MGEGVNMSKVRKCHELQSKSFQSKIREGEGGKGGREGRREGGREEGDME